MRRVLVAVLLSVPLLAQSPEEWDVERRLAERFDEARNAERMAAAVKKYPKLAPRPKENAPGTRYFVIDGERNPELLLPHELFDTLLKGVDPVESTRELPRKHYGEKLGDFGWDAATFWTKLEDLSADYRKVRFKTQTAAGQAAACRARFDALEQARKTFGKKEFDAFLYRSVAPSSLTRTATNEPNPAASLRRESRGCEGTIAASSSERPPWEWTLEQRLAARLVPAERKRRVDQRIAAVGAKPNAPRPYDHLEGRIRPELLMQTEIVEVFIEAAFLSDDERTAQVRADAVHRAAKLGLPAEFLPTVEKALAEAIAARKELARMSRTLTAGQAVSQQVAARLTQLQRDGCRGRWKGIQTLRRTYGATFDRFLYEVVAPNVRKTFYEPTTAESLRQTARGCP